MPSDDLKTYATSTTDFYSLLGISPETSQPDIDRAFRKTALKYHPDKVGPDNALAKENFHLAQIGHEILSSPDLKALYDNARSARERKSRQDELFGAKRRAMREELEGRERKRGREEDEAAVGELRRLADDGKRRREMRNEALIREIKALDEERAQRSPVFNIPSTPDPTTTLLGPTATTTETPSPDILQRIRARGSAATSSTITGSPFRGGSGGAGSPSLLEATMMRLKDAEKRRAAAAAAKTASQVV